MKKNIFETIQGWAVLIGAQFLALSGTGKGIVVLVIMFHLDLITGTYASWYEAKQKSEKPKVYFLESKKLRQSVAKALWYIFLIIGVWMIERLYFDQTIGIPYSTKQFLGHQIAIGVCIAIEFWSNLENFKRCGFDVIAKIKSMSVKIWGLLKTVKHGEDN